MPGKNSLRLEPRPDCRFRKTCRWSWQTRECPGEERPQVSALDRCLCISCRAAPRARNLHGGFRSPRKLPAAEFGGPNSTPCRDRKSTRLNSSHLGISYAVFCLKKKKNSTSHVRPRGKSSTTDQTARHPHSH